MKTKLIPLLALFGFTVSGLADEPSAPKLTQKTAEKTMQVQLEVELVDKGNPAGSAVRCKVSIFNNTSTPITVYDREGRLPVNVLILDPEQRYVAGYSDWAKENPPPEVTSVTIPAQGRIMYEMVLYGNFFDKDTKPVVLPKGQYTARAGFECSPEKLRPGSWRTWIRMKSNEVKFSVE